MRIAIDTEADEFDDAVRAVHAAYGYTYEDEESEDNEDGAAGNPSNGSAILPGGWTEKKLRKWAKFLTEDAQEVIRYIAANAPEVHWDDAAAHLGAAKGLSGPVSGAELGGTMSSGGHARKRLRGAPTSQPLDRDHSERIYVIDERVAAILADELGQPAS